MAKQKEFRDFVLSSNQC